MIYRAIFRGFVEEKPSKRVKRLKAGTKRLPEAFLWEYGLLGSVRELERILKTN